MSAKAETYRERIRKLSDALVEAQRPIRILDAIKWDNEIQESVFASEFRYLPEVDATYYETKRPLPFDAQHKIAELEQLASQIERDPGRDDVLGTILLRNCRNYADSVRMLVARGTPDFFKYSAELYGQPADAFPGDNTTILDLGNTMGEILESIHDRDLGNPIQKSIPAETVVSELQKRFSLYFGADANVRVMLDDGILADAAAGSDYVKIKRGVEFSQIEIDLLERHEGWVHVGTTLNGARQQYASWLGKGPPCVSAIQEGLAVLMELITFSLHPGRGRKLNDRILACDLAVQGADFLEVCEFYRLRNYSELDSYRNASRIFRGGVAGGGAPFTKDIGYCKGMVMIYNFMRTAIHLGKPAIIPFLFAGKLVLEDVPVLYQLHQEGIIKAPDYLPPQFRDLHGLAMWMAFSNFFNRVNLTGVRSYYARMIAAC